MPSKYVKGTWPVITGILAAGLLPILLYWICCAGVPTQTGAETRRTLLNSPNQTALVDVREQAEFKAGHIQGALNWPFSSINTLTAADQIPLEFRGRTLFLICDAGLASAWAVRKINSLDARTHYNVKDGLQNWAKGLGTQDDNPYSLLVHASGQVQPFPVRPASLFIQALICFTAFFIKPLYMILSLAVIWMLRNSRTTDLKSLKWAMICFLTGEVFCAVNYLFFQDESHFVEYLHIYGMMLAIGFTVHAFMEGLDQRIMHLRDPRKKCTAASFCVDCIKYNDVACGFSRILFVLSLMLICCAAIPLLAGIHCDSYNSEIFGSLYFYTHPAIHQYFESRYAPLLAMVCFSAVALLTRRKSARPGPAVATFFAAGAGLLGFSFFRLILFSIYRDQLEWFVIWEEITELLYILGVIAVLRLFRKSLLQKRKKN